MDGSKDKGVISPRLYVEPLFFNTSSRILSTHGCITIYAGVGAGVTKHFYLLRGGLVINYFCRRFLLR